MTDYNELKKLAEAATQGEWFHATDVGQIGSIEDAQGNVIAASQQFIARDIQHRQNNAAYIAAANPATVLQMIAHISHQEQRVAELEAEARRFDYYFGSSDKTDFINEYLKGVRKNWSLAQWRIAIDLAIAKSSKDQQDNRTEGV